MEALRGNGGQEVPDNSLEASKVERELKGSGLGLLEEILSLVVEFAVLGSRNDGVKHVGSDLELLQVSRVDFVDTKDNLHGLAQGENGLSLKAELPQVASLRDGLKLDLGLLLEHGVDESGDLKVLLEPGHDGELLQVDSIGLALHQHGDGSDPQVPGFSGVGGNS